MDNGALELDSHRPPEGIVFLASPIRWWWQNDLWGGPEFQHYHARRLEVEQLCVDNWFLVFSPHKAFRGPWTENAQGVNAGVVSISDVVIGLWIRGVEAKGTASEMKLAAQLGKHVLWVDVLAEDFREQVADGLRAYVARKNATPS